MRTEIVSWRRESFNPDEPRPYDPEKPKSGQGQALRNALSTVNDVIEQIENAQEIFVQAVRADLRVDVGSADLRRQVQKPRLRL